MTHSPEDVTTGARALEPLPCPFCGVEPTFDRRFHNIKCTNHQCGTQPEGVCHDSDVLALIGWNTRAGLAAMPDHTAELLEALEDIPEILEAYQHHGYAEELRAAITKFQAHRRDAT